MILPPSNRNDAANGLAGLAWLKAYLNETGVAATDVGYDFLNDAYQIRMESRWFPAARRLDDIGLIILHGYDNVGLLEKARGKQAHGAFCWITVHIPRIANLSEWQE